MRPKWSYLLIALTYKFDFLQLRWTTYLSIRYNFQLDSFTNSRIKGKPRTEGPSDRRTTKWS